MHAKKWRIPYHSIRFQLITGIIVSLLPFCIYFIYNNNYAVNVVRSQVANTNRKLLSLYMRKSTTIFTIRKFTSPPIFRMIRISGACRRMGNRAAMN